MPGISSIAGRGPAALIVGANDSGETLLRAIRYNAALGIPRGRLRRRPSTCSARASTACRSSARATICRTLTEQYGVEEVLITSGDCPGTQVRRLVEMGREHGFRVKVLPSYEQLLEERVAVHPRPWRLKTCSAVRRSSST